MNAEITTLANCLPRIYTARGFGRPGTRRRRGIRRPTLSTTTLSTTTLAITRSSRDFRRAYVRRRSNRGGRAQDPSRRDLVGIHRHRRVSAAAVVNPPLADRLLDPREVPRPG